jgi:hypothetical protein
LLISQGQFAYFEAYRRYRVIGRMQFRRRLDGERIGSGARCVPD